MPPFSNFDMLIAARSTGQRFDRLRSGSTINIDFALLLEGNKRLFRAPTKISVDIDIVASLLQQVLQRLNLAVVHAALQNHIDRIVDCPIVSVAIVR